MDFQTLERLMTEAKEIEPSDFLRSKRDEGPLNTYYQFFGHLAASIKEPGVFLEIGVQRGGMSHHIITMAPHHRYVGIDIEEVLGVNYPRAYVIRGDSNNLNIADEVKEIASKHGGIFAIFQDSSHHYFPSVREWQLYSPMLRSGGVWFSDDLTPAFFRPGLEPKGMVEYFAELPGEKRYYDDLHFGSVIGAIIP